MIPILKEKLFLSLVKNAKHEDIQPVFISNLSPRNAARVHKYRQKKSSKVVVHKLKKEVSHHKSVNEELKKDIDSLKKTVDLFSKTLEKHDKRKEVASDIIEKKEVLNQLKSDLNNLKEIALEAKKDKDISITQWKSISKYIENLESIVHKKESDIDASMLL
ncbi:hypothetical protein JXA48_00895 [Candidatus Woesearchaeota archaeon]|nr:hypothetical protein [Candidatus Woesearchaeota archaeon]